MDLGNVLQAAAGAAAIGGALWLIGRMVQRLRGRNRRPPPPDRG